MNNHRKKMIAPIVITVLVVLYYIFIFAALKGQVDSIVLRLIVSILPALLGATMIGVCVQRIKEIKGGEEDDLDNY